MTPDLDSMLRRRPTPAMPGALGLTPFAGPSFAGPRLTPPPGFTPPAAFQSASFDIPAFPGQPRTAAGPGADMAMRPDGTGAPLPVGAPVAGGLPGQYESVRTTPQLDAGLAAPAPARSRFTLVQTNPIAARGPQASTGAAMRGTATMQALAQIMASGGQPGAAEQPGGRIAAGGYNVPEGATAAQQAGYLAEQNRLNLATNDEIARLRPSMPMAGQPAEVRANNQRYVDKLLREGSGGQDPQELAAGYRSAAFNSRAPQFTTLRNPENGKTLDVIRENGETRIAPQRPVLTPEEEGQKAGLVKDAELKATDASRLLGEIGDAAESSRVAAGSLKRISDLYGQGATTGFGQPVLSAAQAALSRMTGKNVKLATQQQLEKELNNLVMEQGRALMKGGGAVSNYERELIAKSTANPSLDPQANLAILGVMQRVNERNVALDRRRIELDEQGKTGPEIARELRKLRDSMSVGVDAIGGSVSQGILSKYGIKPKGAK
jgi:hypothetical protein